MTTEPKHTPTPLQEGDQVICNFDSIDGKIKKGAIGFVQGFARFSSYHPREVYVSSVGGRADLTPGAWASYFWERDVQALAAAGVNTSA